jgi:hypothetical protein
MTDLVIDTCTLVHADNTESEYFDCSLAFINSLLTDLVDCRVIVDNGFSFDENENKSLIGHEYINNITPIMLGYKFLVEILSNDRVDFVSNTVAYNTKKFIEKEIANKKDRHFLRVATNSPSKNLISHDFTDYTIDKRKLIDKKLSVKIKTACEI